MGVRYVGLPRRGLARWLVALVAVVLAASPGIARASLTWTGASSVDPGAKLVDVSCPSATQCTAVDDTGHEVTYNPSSPGSPAVVPIATTEQLSGVSCPSTTQCTALGWHEPSSTTCVGVTTEVTFNPQAAGATSPVTLDSDPNCDQLDSSNGIVCPTTTQCTGIESTYYAGPKYITFNPTSPGTPSAVAFPCNRTVGCIDTGYSGDSVDPRPSCISATDCVILSNFGWESVFNPQSSTGATLSNTGDAATTSLACPSATECVGGSWAGAEITFNPTSPGTPSINALPDGVSGGPLVSCASRTDCVFAVDNKSVEGNPETGTWTGEPAPYSDTPDALTCNTSDQCVAVDGTGHSYFAKPSTPAVAKASVSKPKVKGATATVPVKCAGATSTSCKVSLMLKRKGMVLGKSASTLAGGSQKTVKVSLNHKGKALLAKHHRLKVQLLATQTIGGKTSVVATKSLTFKKK